MVSRERAPACAAGGIGPGPVSARIRVAIVEDEPLARRRLERLVRGRPELALAGSFEDPRAARAAAEDVDLLFLDVEMPFADGFAFLDSIPAERRPYVIFVTAHERHALRAIRHDAVDFLLKPFDESDFRAALERAGRRLDAEALRRASARLGGTNAAPALAGVRVVEDGAELLLAPARIDWIRAEGRTILVGTNGRVLRAAGRLADFEARLAAHGFLRVHRACLVNLGRVRAVLPRSHGDRTLVLEDGQRVEMSRHFASRFDALTL